MVTDPHCPAHGILHDSYTKRFDYITTALANISVQIGDRNQICAGQTARVEYIEEEVGTLRSEVDKLKAGTNKLFGAIIFSQIVLVPILVGVVLIALKAGGK